MTSSRRGWSESRIHRWLLETHRPAGLAASFGHDAATLARNLKRPVLCIDQCIEGVHFEPGTSARLAGRKAADRALSDLAASAATPRALLMSASFPGRTEERWIRAAIRAVADRARDFGAELVGGDLACAEGPCAISVAAIGELEIGGKPPARDQVRAGDVLLVTGALGGSRLGRHLRLVPRLAEGRWLGRNGARAMTDLSDGLARDVSRLAQRSGVAIEIESVPIHRDARRAARASGRSALEHALYDGEDHELVVALAPARARVLLTRASRESMTLQAIGRVRTGSGVRVPRAEGSLELVPVDLARSWTHGRA
ncbi:MAG TPA: thiamine-phosphate kinase [Planctomycetota bacterium]|nr:thiamine-phosphate kinase [Planctomycetota bacterium]